MCVGKRDCVLYLLLRFRVLLHYQYLHASKKPHILQVYVIVYWDLIFSTDSKSTGKRASRSAQLARRCVVSQRHKHIICLGLGGTWPR